MENNKLNVECHQRTEMVNFKDKNGERTIDLDIK